MLQKIIYFSDIEPESKAAQKLLQYTQEISFEDKQMLFLEGEPSQGLYFLARGQVRIFKTGSRGKEQSLYLVGPGITFNDVPALDGGINPASAQALEPSLVYIIPSSIFKEMFETEPVVARHLAWQFAMRLRQMTALAGDISLKHVMSRIAKILLTHISQDGPGPEVRKGYLTAQLTQEQIAAMAGTVREMVGRSLRAMEANGAIETHRGYILIKEKNTLESLANL